MNTSIVNHIETSDRHFLDVEKSIEDHNTDSSYHFSKIEVDIREVNTSLVNHIQLSKLLKRNAFF